MSTVYTFTLKQADGSIVSIDTNKEPIEKLVSALTALGDVAETSAVAGGTGSIHAKTRLLTSQMNSLLGYVDGVEGYIDQIEGYVDGIETLLTAANALLTNLVGGSYKAVAASQTDAVLGGSGAAGDYLARIIIIPSSTSPGAVSVKDGSGSAMTVFSGGISSVPSLAPICVELGMTSSNGAWKITTNGNETVIAFGKFT